MMATGRLGSPFPRSHGVRPHVFSHRHSELQQALHTLTLLTRVAHTVYNDIPAVGFGGWHLGWLFATLEATICCGALWNEGYKRWGRARLVWWTFSPGRVA